MTRNAPTRRRHDPNRRERIIAAALEVIGEHGVSGTTHRRVAAAADVPLGSMTYHFESLDRLVVEAFDKLSQDVSAYYRQMFLAAQSQEEACEAVVDIICGGTWTDLFMAQLFELYAVAARKPEVRTIMSKWMRQSREAMELHFPPRTSRALDAIIEGVTIHNMTFKNHLPREEVRAMVWAIVKMD